MQSVRARRREMILIVNSDDMCVGKILCAPQVCEQSECAQRSVSSSKKGHISMPLF